MSQEETKTRPIPLTWFTLVNSKGVPCEQWTNLHIALDALASVKVKVVSDRKFGFESQADLDLASAKLRALGWKGEFQQLDWGANPSHAEVLNLDPYGSGWSFTIAFSEWCFSSGVWERREQYYRTNKFGEGLWMNEKQITGTCQYELPSEYDEALAYIMEQYDC